MPDAVPAAPNLYALLIGIDYYKPNPWYKSLQGCVRDINLVDDFLKQTLQPPPETNLQTPLCESRQCCSAGFESG